MYHELVEAGQEQFLRETNEKVRVVAVKVSGKLEIVMPDHKDEDGNVISHGGCVSVKGGDFLVGREDGSLFGVPSDRYRDYLASSPASIPVVQLEKKG